MACEDDAWPYVEMGETAAGAWKELLARYEGLDTNDLVALSKEWADCKIKSSREDPALYYQELKKISAEIVRAGGRAKEEYEYVAHLKSQMPKDTYKTTTEVMEENQVTSLVTVLERYRARWKLIYGLKSENQDSDNVAYAVVTGGNGGGGGGYKKFKGTP
jgi:hypothetical protein